MANKTTYGKTSAKIKSLFLGSEEAAVALYLCEECYKIHTRPVPLRGHVLLESSQMPQSKGHGQSLTETCAVHKQEAIKFLCTDHNIFGCDLCNVKDHSNCQKLNVNEAAKDFQSSQEYQNMFKEIEKVKTTSEEVIESVKENMQIIQTSKEDTRKQITTFRKEINNKLDEWEQSLHKQYDSNHDRENLKATSALYDSRDILQKVEQLQENLTRLQAAGSKIKLYIKAKRDQKTLKDLQERIVKMKGEAYSVIGFPFYRSNEVYNLMRSGLGQIMEYEKRGLKKKF